MFESIVSKTVQKRDNMEVKNGQKVGKNEFEAE